MSVPNKHLINKTLHLFMVFFGVGRQFSNCVLYVRSVSVVHFPRLYVGQGHIVPQVCSDRLPAFGSILYQPQRGLPCSPGMTHTCTTGIDKDVTPTSRLVQTLLAHINLHLFYTSTQSKGRTHSRTGSNTGPYKLSSLLYQLVVNKQNTWPRWFKHWPI